jgi:predicted RNA binding protein YcfA (HicA-like mRNA interferase family)
MGESLPGISGVELIKLLKDDGWSEGRRTTHGIQLSKRFGDRVRVTIVPTKHKAMPSGTLAAILGPKQTGIGREGLLTLLKK